MPRYLISQVVAVVTIVVGWSIMLGGSTITYLWINKALIISVLPTNVAAVLGALPDYVFLLPVACVFVLGLIVSALGHILQVALGNVQYPEEQTGNQRNQYDF